MLPTSKNEKKLQYDVIICVLGQLADGSLCAFVLRGERFDAEETEGERRKRTTLMQSIKLKLSQA